MRAVVFERHGGPEVLEYREVPDPTPGHGEVLIRVKAAGANYNDIWARRGEPETMRYILPHISGSDASGVVEAVGPGVTSVKPGDEVLVHPGISCRRCEYCTAGKEFFCRSYAIWGFQTGPLDGGHAELARLPEANVIPKPPGLSFEEAASLPLVLLTAWRMLVTRARIKPGEYVLIWGAAGGLGSMAIQIARLAGAVPIAVVGKREKVRWVQELGAEHVVVRTEEDVLEAVRRITGKRGVDVVFEHTGASTWDTSVKSLKWGGTLVTCGATTGYIGKTDIRYLWNKQMNFLGSHMGTKAELLEALGEVERGRIRPAVGMVLPLKEVPRGQEMMEKGEVTGKVVYVPEGG